MIKLIATDLDGTLLNGLHRSDKWSEQAVKTTLAQHKYFAVATGRHLHANHRVGLAFINEPIYKVCMNGALVLTPENEVLYEQGIDEAFVQQLCQTFPDIPFEWVTHQGVYIRQSKWNHFTAQNKGGFKLKYWVKHLIGLCIGQFETFTNRQEPVLKIDCYVGDTKQMHALQTFLAAHADTVRNAGPNAHHFEITAAQVNKQVGVMQIVKQLELSENEVAVYGNDYNDLEMLSYFEQSYAPNNAIDAVKAVVKEVLPSNRENGVAKHILKTLNQ